MTATLTAERAAGASFAARWRDNFRRYRFEYALISPALLFAALVILYPIIYALDTALHQTVFLEKTQFVGLGNFTRFLSGPDALRLAVQTAIFVFGSLLLTMPIGLGLALLLDEAMRLRTFFRAVLVLPWVISQVVTALLWSWILNPQFGPARIVTDLAGLMPINFVGEDATAMASLILVNTWRTYPFAMLLILAALQTIPAEVKEAARMDTHAAWRRIVFIILPMIRPTLMVVAIMLTLSAFNNVDLPLVLTGGGPLGATETLGLGAYRQAFELNRLGLGSAIAVLIFGTNIVLSVVYIRILRSERLV